MNDDDKVPLFSKIKHLLIGDARSVSDPSIFHKLSLIAFFAWVGLGADGLSSSCYGPEEAFLALGKHSHLGVFVALGSVITIFVISASYHQIIKLFPTGGGGYLVASKLLSPTVGMVSGSALLIDYLLTITLSVASGADAIFSFLPATWLPYKLTVAVLGVVILIWLNLRGVKESVLPLVPIFLIFLVTHAFAIIYAIATHAGSMPEVVSKTISDVQSTGTEMGTFGMLFLILRAYSMGAGTFTGIEAVSNGIPILREPKVKTATHTMNYMAISLAVTVAGLMTAYLLFNVGLVPGKTLNAVLFENMTSGWVPGARSAFVLLTLVSEAVLLFVAAQTGFLDGPRVLSNMALDRWAPTRFASLNDRLVTQNGILMMGIASIALMIYSGGSVKLLVIFYSINVFITFTLSQLGMVRHWWLVRGSEGHWKKKLFINGVGLVMTTFILVSVVILKFNEGGWLTIFITGSLVALAVIIKRHYKRTGRLLGRLAGLVDIAEADRARYETKRGLRRKKQEVDPKAKTAVLFVNGFSGTGLHTLFTIMRVFSGIYKNFIFIQIGLIDSGLFKGVEEIEQHKAHIEKEAGRYVSYMRAHGFNAESRTAIGVDVVDESTRIAAEIVKSYPRSIFFAGQLVFPEDTFFTRWLHNYSAFAIQRVFYHRGIPILILPIRL
ncbi:MAG: APC family permease [Spirochaetes bacterium]|nr:APC family permease [Spirochaetota bacterium]HOD14679.1 APC family permease [Spirochaetota bacterium]HPG49154.1 APC family permease [Spirochaetota bacterium]